MSTTMEALEPFGVPVFIFRVAGLEELNEALRAAALEERAADPGVIRSNRGGWHSRPTLAARPEPHWRALTQLVQEHMALAMERLTRRRGLPPGRWRWSLEGWSMIMEQGDHAALHDHRPADWSAVWYVDPGGDGGALTLVQPGRPQDGALAALLPDTLTITPEAGTLVVFPSFLPHGVLPFRGARPRVSVAFNAVLTPLAPTPGLPPR